MIAQFTVFLLIQLLMAGTALAGTFEPQDPDLPSIGICDRSLANTDLQQSRCRTKDAIFGALVWLTPGSRLEIDTALDHCNNNSSERCRDLDAAMHHLSQSVKEIDAAYAAHPFADAAWLAQLRASVGSDPTRYAAALDRFHSSRAAPDPAPSTQPTKRGLPTLVSMSSGLIACLSEIGVALYGSELILDWQNDCQRRLPDQITVTVDLYDDRQDRIASFANSQFEVLFVSASSFFDGPFAVGTTVVRPGGKKLTATPERHTSIGFPIQSIVSQRGLARIVGAKLTFELR